MIKGNINQVALYLSGPMDHCTRAERDDWRDYVKAWWSGCILDPCRREGKNRDPQQLVMMDKADIMNSDVLLVNYWKNGTGTPMEIMYAFDRGKIVVIVVPDVNNCSWWLKYHSHFICETIDEALQWIRDYYNG